MNILIKATLISKISKLLSANLANMMNSPAKMIRLIFNYCWLSCGCWWWNIDYKKGRLTTTDLKVCCILCSAHTLWRIVRLLGYWNMLFRIWRIVDLNILRSIRRLVKRFLIY